VEAVLRDVRFTQLGGRDGLTRSCGSVYACFTVLFLRAKARLSYVTVPAECSSVLAPTVACGADGALVSVCRRNDRLTRLHVDPEGRLTRGVVSKVVLAHLRRYPRQAAVAADTGVMYIANFGDEETFRDEDDDSAGDATEFADANIRKASRGNVLVVSPQGRVTSVWGRARTSVEAPGGVCVTSKLVIVSCLLTGRLVVLDRTTGAPRRYIGVKARNRYDETPGRLRRPSSVCVFGKRVAVLDRAMCQICVFKTATGTYVDTKGCFVINPRMYFSGLFPHSIASSAHGQLAVYYCRSNRFAVGVFNEALETVFTFQGSKVDTHWGIDGLVLRERDAIVCLTSEHTWLRVFAD
jgi:hypothetical protein